jgi:hypothetical protein
MITDRKANNMIECMQISVDCKQVAAPKMQGRMKSSIKEFDMFGLSEMIHENSNDYAPIPLSLSRKVVKKAKQEIKKIGFNFQENSRAKFHLRELEFGPSWFWRILRRFRNYPDKSMQPNKFNTSLG